VGLNADNISNPIASPPVNTRYIITGTTAEGCEIKGSVNVYRSDEVILTLPNVFTPGSGPNNIFKPIHEGDVVLDYLRIFNRWGRLYESINLNQGWDGTWHGTPQGEGVFVYMMQGHTASGRGLWCYRRCVHRRAVQSMVYQPVRLYQRYAGICADAAKLLLPVLPKRVLQPLCCTVACYPGRAADRSVYGMELG